MFLSNWLIIQSYLWGYLRVGLIVEWIGLRLGRWAYGRMPLIPGLQIGVVPVAQMAVLPLVIFRVAAQWLRRKHVLPGARRHNASAVFRFAMPTINRFLGRQPMSKTALRLIGAFGAILALFAVALAVTLLTLNEIAAMESKVAEIDQAKHAGHHAAALVREQYIHQAHIIINWNLLHLDHYEEVAREAREQTGRLQQIALTSEERARADEVVRLAALNDETFRTDVVPAIQRDDRSIAKDLNDQLEAHVDVVVRENEELNAMLERRSVSVLERTQALRDQALVVIIVCCFGLAIVAALGLGFLLTRSILRPLVELRKGVLNIAQGDLSTRIRMTGRDEFSELASHFNQMAIDLAQHQNNLVRSQKLASIGQIAAGVAHEINNPLGVILGYVKLMLKEPTIIKSNELRIIEDEAHQCQRIVQGLLELARPLRLEMTRVDLAEIARDAIERLKESGSLGELVIDQPAPYVCAVTYGDETKLRQVVFNIIVNAAEAMPSGGRLSIEIAADHNEARLFVKDSGAGIPPDVLAHIFDPFFTTKPKGTGLGLITSQAIVDAHGGTIDIQSEPGRGTCVSLRIPVSSQMQGMVGGNPSAILKTRCTSQICEGSQGGSQNE
ncbi:MAG: Sporulation kinase A [Chromatiales bacterium USCg_Taylor]|nr:MAG: Sporulation kinase A [Chromatiales bacterium USCg_Taylor]